MLRLFVLAALFAAVACAQTASVTGRVTDPAGNVVPDAEVSAQNAATGVTRNTRTNTEGNYAIPAMLPGTYNLTVSKAGFAAIHENGLELQVQQVARLDFAMQVGAVSQSVEVNAGAVLLESETATTGQVIDSRQATELPLLGRNPYALAAGVPGVRPAIGVNGLPVDQITTVAFVINGQRAGNNDFLLDGAPNSAPSQNQPVINTTPDLVQEFKVETSNFMAEYGRASGGIFNVVTRSGANDFHGALYEFFRNTLLNANDFFSNQAGNPRSPFKYNQFGGTVGGPVIIPKVYNGKNRTFFFVSIEKVRFVQGLTFTGTEPTAQQLSGDFSNARNAAGQLITIYDPNTTTSSGGSFTRSPFPGNVIPGARINPVSLAIAKYLPAPTQAGAPFTGVNNYVRGDANDIKKNTDSIRFDHHFNDRNRFFARYSADDTPDIRAGAYGIRNIASPSAGPQIFGRRNSVVEYDTTLSPTLIATLRLSYTRLSNFRDPFSNGFDASTLGLPATLTSQFFPKAFPDITITGYSVGSSVANIITGGLLGATDKIALGNGVWALQGNTTKVLGKHEFKFGGEFRDIQFNLYQDGANNPVFSFAPTWTQGPNPTAATATAGLGLASFLLGIPGGSATPVPALAITTKYYALFAQDSFKVTPRLTVNYGLRWEYNTPRTDRFNQLDNFNYTAAPPITVPGLNLHGALTYVGVGGASRYNATPDARNFAPRLGLAYRLGEKTVIRGGGGIFFADFWGVGTGSGNFGSAGYTTTSTIVTSLDGVNPIVSLSNPFPNGLAQPTGSKLGAATLLGQVIDFYDRGNRTPYAAEWNITIQRQLPGSVVLEAAYTGSRGVKLPLTNAGLNQLPDADLAQGNALRTLVANPFYPQFSSGILASPTVAAAQLLRPYPQFDTVSSDLADIANSTYHALEVKAEKRYARGLTVRVAYTYSKNIDLGVGGGFSGESLSTGPIQDWNNLRGEYSPSLIDQTHRFVTNVAYELPFFKGKKNAAGLILGGWETGAILSLFSGPPLGIVEATSTTDAQGGGQRANWSGVSAKLSNPTVQKWFDTSQFSLAAPYTFGSAARTLSGLHGDAYRGLDFTLKKSFPIKERVHLQFRAEVFNITNTPQFGVPGTSLGAAGFGTVTSQSNQPRVVQFALKLLF